MRPTGLRLAGFYEFVLAHVPPPARVLEVGCGGGELALALAAAGHDVTAIDPDPPEGEIFVRASLEEFGDPGLYDAVVASVSLHHVDDVAAGLDKIARLLSDDGVLLLDEWAKERVGGPTARWLHLQRCALAAVRGDDVEDDFDAWNAARLERLHHVHPLADVRHELDRRFAEREFAWLPYLYDYYLHDALEPLERALIEEGAIEAVGFRYAGTRR